MIGTKTDHLTPSSRHISTYGCLRLRMIAPLGYSRLQRDGAAVRQCGSPWLVGVMATDRCRRRTDAPNSGRHGMSPPQSSGGRIRELHAVLGVVVPCCVLVVFLLCHTPYCVALRSPMAHLWHDAGTPANNQDSQDLRPNTKLTASLPPHLTQNLEPQRSKPPRCTIYSEHLLLPRQVLV